MLNGFPGGSEGKESTCNAEGSGDTSSIPGWRRSPEGGHGDLLQCSCLENPMDRGAWRAAVHRAAKSQRLLKQRSTYSHTCSISFVFHSQHDSLHLLIPNFRSISPPTPTPLAATSPWLFYSCVSPVLLFTYILFFFMYPKFSFKSIYIFYLFIQEENCTSIL